MAIKNETVERIKKDLESNGEGRYTINSQDFSEIEVPLCESRSRFTYNACDGTFRFIKPTFIHNGGRQWIHYWVYVMERRGMVHKDTLEVYANTDLQTFQGRFAGSKRNPSVLFLPLMRKWPTLVLELGYGESYDELVTGTDILLEGSRGRIGFAIVVWIKCLAASDDEIQEGYVELHKYNKDTGKRDRIEERQQLYPVPPNHSMQCINLSWSDILRNKQDLCLTQEGPPPLYLDDLRGFLDAGTRHHLSFERDEDDDEEME